MKGYCGRLGDEAPSVVARFPSIQSGMSVCREGGPGLSFDGR